MFRRVLVGFAFSLALLPSPGRAQWQLNGTVISTAKLDQQYPLAVPDGAGGAIITWMDYRVGGTADIYAQRINAQGVVQWTADGVAICMRFLHCWEPCRCSQDSPTGPPANKSITGSGTGSGTTCLLRLSPVPTPSRYIPR